MLLHHDSDILCAEVSSFAPHIGVRLCELKCHPRASLE